MPPQLEELRKLPLADKLRIVQQLWDDIAESDEPFPLQEWHADELRRRAAELRADPDMALTREQLWHRVDELDG